MSLLRDIILPAEVYHAGNLPSRQVTAADHYITPPGMIGDTTSNEYMPYLSAFRGMSELVEYGDKRALIYKMSFYQYNAIYSKRARGVNRTFENIMDVFRRGGKTYLLNGDVACEIYAGLIMQRCLFNDNGVRAEGWDPLIMLGVKPEYVFSGGMSSPNLDVTQFCLFVDSRLPGDPVYAKMYKKFSELIIMPLIQYGVRVVFTPNINRELFLVKSFVPKFSSTGALTDYKYSMNDAIDLGDTMNIDYRYPTAVRHEDTPPEPEPEEVSLPGVDGQAFQVTLNAADFAPDFVADERPPLRVTLDTGAIPSMSREQVLQAMQESPLEIIGLDGEHSQPIIPF